MPHIRVVVITFMLSCVLAFRNENDQDYDDSQASVPNNFCGLPTEEINRVLEPPDMVRKLLPINLGDVVSIGKTRTRATCDSLPTHASKDYIMFEVTSLSMFESMLGNKNKKKGGNKTQTMPAFAGAFQAVNMALPLCVLARPCGTGKDTLWKQWDFGINFENGILVFKEPSTMAEFWINGLAFSTAGNLVMDELDPPLKFVAGDLDVSHVHVWMKGKIGFPIGIGGQKKPLLNVEIDGTIGAYVNIGGEADIAQVIANLMSPPPGKSVLDTFKAGSEFRLVAQANAEIMVDMEACFGKLGEGMDPVGITSGLSMMLRVFATHPLKDSFIEAAVSTRTELDIKQLLSVTKILETLIDDIPAAVVFALYFKVKGDGLIDFGLEFSASVKLNCKGFGGEFIHKVLPICDKTAYVGVKLWAKGGRLDRDETCLSILGKQYCLNDLPSCPPPVFLGDSCSENADCTGSEYGSSGQGYCKSENGVTTAGCTGKCFVRVAPGMQCSSGDAAIINLAGNSADELCQSNKCLCDTCTDGSHALPDGKRCVTNANCKSGYCKTGVFAAGCTGQCQSLLSVGTRCNHDMACQSPHNCNCGHCGDTNKRLPRGKPCSSNRDCQSNKCENWVDMWWGRQQIHTINCAGKCY